MSMKKMDQLVDNGIDGAEVPLMNQATKVGVAIIIVSIGLVGRWLVAGIAVGH